MSLVQSLIHLKIRNMHFHYSLFTYTIGMKCFLLESCLIHQETLFECV